MGDQSDRRTDIRTEGELIAKFNPTEALVDKAYFRAYDSLSTVNAIIYLICGLVTILFSFIVVYASGRLTDSESVSYQAVGWPLFAVGCLAVAFTVFMFYYSITSGMDLMTRVIPLFVLLVVSLVVLWGFLENTKTDQWQITPDGISEASTSNILFLGAVGLSLISAAVCWINSKLRTDRLHFMGTGFLSFIVTTAFLTWGMMYVASFVLGQVRTNDIDKGLQLPLYIAGGLAAFFGILIADSIAVQLVNVITNFSKAGDYAAAAPELANATYRSRQMVMSMFFFITLVPFALVWFFRDGLVENVSTGAVSGGYVVIGTLTILPFVTLIGAAAMELRMATPSLYFAISNVMIGFVFAVIGTQLIPWTKETLFAVGLLLFGIASIYLLAGNIGSNLSVVALIGASFMAVKYCGKLVIENIGDDASDTEKLLLLGMPLLIFTSIWFFRSYYKGDSYSVPFTLMIFSLVYIFSYFNEATATKKDYILSGANNYVNIGLDFVLVTSVLMGVTSLGAFSETQVDFIQKQTATQDASATGTIAKFAVNILIGYGGAVLYNFLQTNDKVEDYLRESQDNALEVWNRIRNDFE